MPQRGDVRRALQRLVQRPLRSASCEATTARSASSLRRPAADAGGVRAWSSSPASRSIPLLGAVLLPAHRRRPVRDQSEGPTGHPPRRSPKARSPKSKRLVREVVRTGRSRHDRLQHRRRARLLRRSTPATPAPHTAFVQVSLKEDHKIGSYEYMARVKQRIARRDAAS